MKKKIIGVILVSLVLAVSTGCSKEKTEVTPVKTTPPSIVVESEPEPKMITVPSPLTGEQVEEENINPRVIAVMIDNHPDARPQAGLKEFDIVYEILAEGNITRYLGIIGTTKPTLIGPVRSARDYFIERALEYDALYVHFGGSTQGYAYIKNNGIPTIDGMYLGGETFWRKNHRWAPHNAYSKYSGIIQAANNYKYREEGEHDALKFYKEDRFIKGEELTEIKFTYSPIYTSSYKYDKKEKVYYRFINGEQLVDEVDETEIYAKNIIVQFTRTRLIPNDELKKITIDMIGEGDGYYITNGMKQDITWKKTSNKDLTRYYDDSGKEITLNPGKIWVQVFPDNRPGDLIIIGKESIND